MAVEQGPGAGQQASAGGRDRVRELVTPARLRDFFAPRSIALVGASETSGWARLAVLASTLTGFSGPLIPIHPRHETAFGRPVVRSLRDLAHEPPDLAFIMVPTHAVSTVIDDAAAAGVRNVVVLASGYREVGSDGLDLEGQLVAQAAAAGITLLGPNCLGFINVTTGAAPFGLYVPMPLTPGPVGVALQSGALTSVVLGFARSHAIGISSLTSVGNEAMIGVADMIEYLVDDENTKVICLFLEQIGDPAAFARAAARADAAGKPIVALKAGATEAGQKAALAHTGSVAGDDAVVDAVLRQLNVIRVRSLEELMITSAMLGYSRVPGGRRMGVVTASGGACDIIADRSSELGIEVPDFAPETAAAISEHLPPFAAARNPLDVTGYVLANAATSFLNAMDYALDATVKDPGLDFVLYGGVNPPEAPPPDELMAQAMEQRMAWISELIATSPIPVLPINPTTVDVGPHAREVLSRHNLHVYNGIDLGLAAVDSAVRWQDRRGTIPAGLLQRPLPEGDVTEAEPWSEAEARSMVAARGVPVVPGELVTSADEAADAAQRLGLPVALKIVSAQITHKSDIGGVALHLGTAQDVRAAYEKVRAAGAKVAGATVDGVLVTPMRSGGTELLAGVTLDPTFGPVLAVGLGGVWVEILKDIRLRALPVDAAEVRRMLEELRGIDLLRGARGSQPADLDAIAAVIAKIGDAALSLNGTLRALEVNPLWVNGDQVEALDVLIATGPDGKSGTELGA
jgi:acetate---CoA ligase (ADP-forming)